MKNGKYIDETCAKKVRIAKDLGRDPGTVARFVGLTGDPAANGVIYDAMELTRQANALRKQCRTQAKKEKRE